MLRFRVLLLFQRNISGRCNEILLLGYAGIAQNLLAAIAGRDDVFAQSQRLILEHRVQGLNVVGVDVENFAGKLDGILEGFDCLSV